MLRSAGPPFDKKAVDPQGASTFTIAAKHGLCRAGAAGNEVRALSSETMLASIFNSLIPTTINTPLSSKTESVPQSVSFRLSGRGSLRSRPELLIDYRSLTASLTVIDCKPDRVTAENS